MGLCAAAVECRQPLSAHKRGGWWAGPADLLRNEVRGEVRNRHSGLRMSKLRRCSVESLGSMEFYVVKHDVYVRGRGNALF